jgi:hypothetical protein
MCCPDQSSYELARNASLLEGNRTREGLAPGEPPNNPAAGPVSPRADDLLPYVRKAALRNRAAGRAGQFMDAVFVPGAIATCAPGRASVNCPNKKC